MITPCCHFHIGAKLGRTADRLCLLLAVLVQCGRLRMRLFEIYRLLCVYSEKTGNGWVHDSFQFAIYYTQQKRR